LTFASFLVTISAVGAGEALGGRRLNRLGDLAKKRILRIVGLISGTSVDGIDAALVEVSGPPEAPEIRQVAFATLPHPSELRREILEVARGERRTAGEISHLDHAVGDCFGDAALHVVEKAELPLEELDLVGSHGQTIFHDPDRGETWQIGEPSRIAAKTRTPVVSDFRRADLAAGGQGAPLVPLLDALVFRSEKRGRVLLNIGGIANVSVLPKGKGREDVFAFDTGPGNVLIDEFLHRATEGKVRYDEDGRIAARGQVDEELLAGFLEHPYFHEKPPKSTGREVFGAGFVALTLGEWARTGDRLEDLVATLTEFTAISIAGSIQEYVCRHARIDEVLVSGGGVHNKTLMRRIAEELDGIPVASLETIGFSPDAKEALAFALIARETVCGRAGNIPKATGAKHPVVLGVVTPAPLA
jgi:anhydro-N-acetylmuramic acid kinase